MRVESIDKKYKCSECNTVAIFEVHSDTAPSYKICGIHLPDELKGMRP